MGEEDFCVVEFLGVINKLLYEYAASLPVQASLVAQRVKKSACNVGDPGSIPGLGRFPWRREWLPTLVFLPGDSHGQRSLVGYNRVTTESDTTEMT